MDLSRYGENTFTVSINPDEGQAIRYALAHWAGQADIPAIDAAGQLLTAAALLEQEPKATSIAGLSGNTILALSASLKEYHDHTTRCGNRIFGRLAELNMATATNVTSEVSRVCQIGDCAGQLAVDLASEHDRLTSPARPNLYLVNGLS